MPQVLLIIHINLQLDVYLVPHTMPSLFKDLLVWCLFERQTDRKWEKERFFTCWLTPQMATKARARPAKARSQCYSWSPVWLLGAQVPAPFSVAFLDTVIGSWTTTGAAGMGLEPAPLWDASIASCNFYVKTLTSLTPLFTFQVWELDSWKYQKSISAPLSFRLQIPIRWEQPHDSLGHFKQQLLPASLGMTLPILGNSYIASGDPGTHHHAQPAGWHASC